MVFVYCSLILFHFNSSMVSVYCSLILFHFNSSMVSVYNIRSLSSTVAEKNVMKNVHICSMCIKTN
jgi:hypothetical protein